MRITIRTYKIKALFSLMTIGLLLMSGCENDMRDVAMIEHIQEEEAVDTYHQVRISWRDSTQMKTEVAGPGLRIYHGSSGKYAFQKGIQIILYYDNSVETQRISAKYGLQRTKEGITQCRDNVAIT